MSAEWIYGSLGSLFDTVTGSTPPKSNPKNYGDDMFFVKPPELKDGPIIETADGLSHHGSLIARILPAGSILVSCIGNLGKVGLAECPVAFNQQINAIKPSDKALPLFMFYQSQAPSFLSQLENLASGTTVPIVNKSKFNSIQVAIPPITEQQRIVAILDQAFADIEKARANAEKNLKNARELFDSYLNQVFSQRGEGWVEKPLGELFDVRDGTHDSPSYQESGFPLVTSKNLINGQISLEKVKYISTTDFEKINKRSKVDIGDVLLAMIGTIGNPVVVTQKPSYAIKNVALIKGIPSQNSSFLKYFLESPFTVKKMLAEAKGTTQKFVGLGYLRAFPFYAPSFTEQQHIVASLDKLSMEVQQLEKGYQEKLNSLEELKKSLLQKAFSGELTKTEGHAA